MDHEPWTAEGAERLRRAGERLANAITTHAQVLASGRGTRDIQKIFAANDELLHVALAYADAQFDYTGTGFPFGALQEFADEDSDEDAEDVPDAVRPAHGISVLRRHDYAVTDEAAILAAGRAAYLRVWVDDSAENAAADVTHLGRALYQLAHADGWDSLDRADGLRPLGGVIRVIDQDDVLSADPDEWPADPFATEGALRYEQSAVWS